MAIIDLAISDQFPLSHSIVADNEIVLDAYGSLSRANLYFDNRLRSEPWKLALISEKKSALTEATMLIDRLNYKGDRAVDGQARQFPRGTDTSVPPDVEKATYEIALKLLDGYDPDMEIDTLPAHLQSYSSVRSAYDRGWVLEHLRAGIPSAKAWDLLKPYLNDPKNLLMLRTS